LSIDKVNSHLGHRFKRASTVLVLGVIRETYTEGGGGPLQSLLGVAKRLFLFLGHTSFAHGNSNGLFLGTTFLDHLADVLGDGLL